MSPDWLRFTPQSPAFMISTDLKTLDWRKCSDECCQTLQGLPSFQMCHFSSAEREGDAGGQPLGATGDVSVKLVLLYLFICQCLLVSVSLLLVPRPAGGP